MSMIAVAKRGRFGLRLRAIREAAGLTQQDLADMCGMLPRAIGRIENGTDPAWETALKLAQALEVSLDEFTSNDEGEE